MISNSAGSNYFYCEKKQMKTEKDYREFLTLLNRHKARFLVVGAYALGFHGYVRYSKDLDLLIEPTRVNAKKIMKVLCEFGFGNIELREKDFIKKGNIIQLGYEPIRIDILTSVKGSSFGEMWKTKETGCYGNEKVFFIGKNALIKLKKAANRKIDILDLEILKQIEKMEKKTDNGGVL